MTPLRGWRRLGVALTLIVCLASLTCFAQTIALPRAVPSFNQAYTDGPDAWGRCRLGTAGCPDQIYTTGCLVTAFSSVLAYFEIELTVPARSSCTGEARTGMDPGIFNDWLREVGGYGHCQQDPIGNCCLIWERLPAELEITAHINRSEVGLNPVASVIIDHALRQGQPVVAGVHWGGSCNGTTTQTEDCHWVILTGKRDESYTIVDPFNPDSANPRGVQTTLDAGVHGSYIIDRFVVVEGSSPKDVTLEIQTIPQQSVYQVGGRLQLSMTTPRNSAALLPFARVTKPSGTIAYVTLGGLPSGPLGYKTARASLVETPLTLSSAWTWFDNTLSDTDIGRWTWEIWVEQIDEPGTKFARQIFSYEVEPASPPTSIGTAIIGILLIAAIAAVAFMSTLKTGVE